MKTAKAAYSEEKKAYDSRNVAESEVANVANATPVAVRVILFALGSLFMPPFVYISRRTQSLVNRSRQQLRGPPQLQLLQLALHLN